MRILVIGKDGQVGHELARLVWRGNNLILVGRQDCDLSDPQSIRNLVRSVAPQIVVNAAAYTAVDKAETERDLCFAVNATAPLVLAEEAARLDALLIHYSTDYVFNGEKTEPYLETDTPDPLSVYGSSKAAGEAAIARTASRYLLLRTTWVYGAHGKNFLRTMLRLAQDRPELRVVDDQIGAPTSAPAIAAATASLIGWYSEIPADFACGVYHMTAGGSTSWCGFARAILSTGAGGAKPRVLPISAADYPTPAKRPKNSVLSNDKFERTFGFRLAPWEAQLADVLAGVEFQNK